MKEEDDLWGQILDVESEEAAKLIANSQTYARHADKNIDALKILVNDENFQRDRRAELETARLELGKLEYLEMLLSEDMETLKFLLYLSDAYSWVRELIETETDLKDYKLDLEKELKDGTADRSDLQWGLRELDQYEKTKPSLGGGKSSSSWALGSISSGRKKIVNEALENEHHKVLFPGGKSTLHHMVSRSHLSSLHADIEKDEAAPFKTVVEAIGTDLSSASSLKKILNNMPFNLEVGPPVSLRQGDPGAEFDGDVPATTRTNELVKVDNLSKKSGRTEEEWAEAAEALQNARSDHKEDAKGKPLATPIYSQWSEKDGKFKRGG